MTVINEAKIMMYNTAIVFMLHILFFFFSLEESRCRIKDMVMVMATCRVSLASKSPLFEYWCSEKSDYRFRIVRSS